MPTFTVFNRLDSGKAYWQNDAPLAVADRGAAVSTFSTQAAAVADANDRQKKSASGHNTPVFVVVQTA